MSRFRYAIQAAKVGPRWVEQQLERLGRATVAISQPVSNGCSHLANLFGVIGVGLALAVRPRTWTQPVRDVFYRQMLFTGVEAVGLAIRFAFALGVLIVVQTVSLIGDIPDSEHIVIPIVYHTVVRELVPLVANLIVIGRSSTAMAIETANMTLDHEVEVLDAQGVDPMKYLIVPRMLSMSLSVFFIAIIVLFGVFVFGYLMAWMLNLATGDVGRYGDSLRDALEPLDAVFFLTKTVLIGLLVGAISATTGMQVRQSPTEVPQAATRAAVLSLSAVFASSAVLSVLFYRKLMMIPVQQFFGLG